MNTTLKQPVKNRGLCLLGIGVLLFPSTSPSGGFRLPDQDAFATARGEAFAATADNPSAVYYNPAGLAQLRGHHVRGGVYAIWYESQYESPGGQTWDSDGKVHPVPQAFYAYGPEAWPMTFGFGVYSPYGLSQEWPQDVPFRQAALKGSITSLTFNPSFAWRVAPAFSLGGGLTFNRAEADLRQGLFPPPSTGDQFRFQGDDTAWGWNLGLLWRVHSNLCFGATYRSSVEFNLEGSVTLTPALVPPGPGQAGLPFPASMVVGVSWRPTPAWNLEVNVERTDWSKLKTLTVQSAFLPPASTPLNWEASYYYELGITRHLKDGWRWSAGYIFNENSMPTPTYNPLVADVDKHFLSTGIGRSNRRWDFDVAYQFGFSEKRTVVGTPLADGSYRFLSHALFVTVGTTF